MRIEVVCRPGLTDVEVCALPLVPLDEDVVRHHTTFAHPIVCAECSRALAPEQARRNGAGEHVCRDRDCT